MQKKTLTIAVDLHGTLQMPDGRDVPNAWVWIATLKNAGAKFTYWPMAEDYMTVRRVFAEQDIQIVTHEKIDYFIGLKCIGCPTTFDTNDPTFPDFVDWENVGDMILRHLDVLNNDNEFTRKEADQSPADAG